MCLFVCSSEPSQEQFDGSRRAVNSCPSFDVWTQNKMQRGSLTLSRVVASCNHLLWRGPPRPPALPCQHEPRWGKDWKRTDCSWNTAPRSTVVQEESSSQAAVIPSHRTFSNTVISTTSAGAVQDASCLWASKQNSQGKNQIWKLNVL